MMTELINMLPTILLIVGALAFITSVITQVIKGLPALDKLPTDLVVFVLSIGLTVIAFFAWATYIGHLVLWYEVLGAIIGGFVVAFVAMFGWERFYDLWNRFNNK